MFERLRHKIEAIPRFWKRALFISFDTLALIFALWLSYSVRLGVRFVPNFAQTQLFVLAPLIALPIFVRFGLYRAVIRYLPERAIWTIIKAMSLATLVFLAVLFLAELSGISGAPRSIPLLYWAFGTILIAGSRFGAKALIGGRIGPNPKVEQVLIYGADQAASELAAAIGSRSGLAVAGFIDDDPHLRGREISGIRVYGCDLVAGLVANMGISQIILSLPSIAPDQRRAVHDAMRVHPVAIRALPAVADLAAGKYVINQIREIELDDLLGRSVVPPMPGLLRDMISDRVILVTGAGGSIGSELARLVARWRPAKLILFEANEFALYEINRVLSPDLGARLIPVLGSVSDARLVGQVLGDHTVGAVFHAAAHKHVPLVEANVLEGVRNNVFGTRTMAQAALEHGVKDFILISTDKAVYPASVMGATKRWAELITRHYGRLARRRNDKARFCAVRFGNVLGSQGSVVPLFQQQVAQGGPVTLTDERMTRFMMSVHEAVELIVQAGALSEGGDIFLLDMGEPLRIRDLAENVIRLAGLRVRSADNPDGDIEIVVTGARPGEKISEQLHYDLALLSDTTHPKISRVQRAHKETRNMIAPLQALETACESENEARVRETLFEVISAKRSTASSVA